MIYLIIDRKDCRHPFKLRIPATDFYGYMQIFLNQEYDFIVNKQPEVIVDAGANIGLASIYLANKYPDAKIIAIEPEQSNFEILKQNTAPYSNIIPLHAALWHKNEEINLVDPGLGKWGFMADTKKSSEGLPSAILHTVAGITVDTIIKEFNLEKIDILKIDIEGAEKEVFNDTSSWIESVGSMIVELHDRLKIGSVRSFYNGSNGFDNEWNQGENVYLSRNNFLTRRPT